MGEARAPQAAPAAGSRRRGLRAMCVAAGVALALVGGMHAVKAARGQDDVVRHLVFVVLDVGLGAMVAWRPRWALVPVAALSLQQIWSHGKDLLASLRGPGPLDVASLGVLAFFGALVVLLVAVRRVPRAGESA